MIVMNDNSCLISNDNNVDNHKNDHIINYEDLETQVIEAIKKKSTSDLFKDKTPNECMYMQKVAEIYLTWDGIILTLSTFIMAIGVTYIVTFLPLKMWQFVGIGGLLIVFGYLLFSIRHKLRGKFENYRYIIFEAEKKILEGSGETLPQQETNTSNTQENPISIEFIKAQLDLLKLIMAGFLGGILVLSNSMLQNTKTDIIYQLIVLSILFLSMIKLMTDYKKYSKKLNKK